MTGDTVLAFKAALIFVFNHSLVYQLALQSELTFDFLTFLGLLIIYSTVQQDNISGSVRSHQIIVANILFGVSILARSTGALFFLFVSLLFIKKVFKKSDSICKIFKYVFYFWCCLVIIVLPGAMVTLWKPYVMHCETKLDRTDAVNKWCFKDLPNVYNYI